MVQHELVHRVHAVLWWRGLGRRGGLISFGETLSHLGSLSLGLRTRKLRRLLPRLLLCRLPLQLFLCGCHLSFSLCRRLFGGSLVGG